MNVCILYFLSRCGYFGHHQLSYVISTVICTCIDRYLASKCSTMNMTASLHVHIQWNSLYLIKGNCFHSLCSMHYVHQQVSNCVSAVWCWAGSDQWVYQSICLLLLLLLGTTLIRLLRLKQNDKVVATKTKRMNWKRLNARMIWGKTAEKNISYNMVIWAIVNTEHIDYLQI